MIFILICWSVSSAKLILRWKINLNYHFNRYNDLNALIHSVTQFFEKIQQKPKALMLCKQECHVWACPHLFCECHTFVGNGFAVSHTTAQVAWLTDDSLSSWNDQHVPWVSVGSLNSPYKCPVLCFSPQRNIHLWGIWLIKIPLAWAATCGGHGWVARGNEMKNEMTKKERKINMAECSLSIWIMAVGIITAVVELSGRGQSQLHYLIHSRFYSSVKWITILVKRKRTFSLCLWHCMGCVIMKDIVCQWEFISV